MNKKPKFAFFGGEPLAVPVLDALKDANLLPSLIVCNPDRPKGRGQKLTSPPAKVWAQNNNVPVYQPETYKDESVKEKLSSAGWDLFVVVAYNFILPKWLLELPTHGTVNVHPSLLPKLRGASPIRTAILENQPENVGVSIMLLDEEMDHGPILAQTPLPDINKNWPLPGPTLDQLLAELGGKLLAKTIPQWFKGEIKPQEQNHNQATYCHKLDKTMAKLELDPYHLPAGDKAAAALRVIYAFAGLGDAFFEHKGIRVKIKAAHLDDEKLIIDRVTPAGKKEMSWDSYLQSIG